MTDNIKDIVKELLAERALVFAKEKELTRKIHEAKLKHSESTIGIKIGGIIKDKKGTLYKVVDIEFWDMDIMPHIVKANPQKKDGSYGTAVRVLWVSLDGLVAVKEGES